MNSHKSEIPFSRRALLTASGLAATGAVLSGGVSASQDGIPARRQPIKIGQIGTGNQHAYKIGTLRKLTDLFEVVGFVEDDPKLREKAQRSSCFKGLKLMSTDELLAVPGITQVKMGAVRPYEIGIHVSEEDLRRHGLTFDEVAEAVRASSLNLPAGEIRADAGDILDEGMTARDHCPDHEPYHVVLATHHTLDVGDDGVEGFVRFKSVRHVIHNR